VGIIGPTPAFASAYAAAEAIKFLSGAHDRLAQGVFCFDFWRNDFETILMTDGPARDCPCCVHRRFTLLRL
jgi:adenylyltransferase/sulfurtransferase